MTRERERAMEIVALFRAGRRQHFYLQELIADALEAVARERDEAVEVMKRWLKADDIGIGLDIREARESARAFIQKQETNP